MESAYINSCHISSRKKFAFASVKKANLLKGLSFSHFLIYSLKGRVLRKQAIGIMCSKDESSDGKVLQPLSRLMETSGSQVATISVFFSFFFVYLVFFIVVRISHQAFL